jgi:hypothetical protein
VKANLRFLFAVVFLSGLSIASVGSIIDAQRSKYEGPGFYYASNNPNGVEAESSDFLTALNSADSAIMAVDEVGRAYCSKFDDIKLASGRFPKTAGEFITPKSDDKKEDAVGVYLETMAFNGNGDIYKMTDGQHLLVTSVVFSNEPEARERQFLEARGLVQIDGENVDKKINAEMYNTIGLVLRLFCALLVFTAVISWISFLVKHVADRHKELQVLNSFGASLRETVVSYFYLQRRVLVRIVVETAVAYNAVAAGVAAALGLNWFALLNWALVASWIGVVVSTAAVVAIQSYSYVQRRVAIPSWTPYALVAAGLAVSLVVSDSAVLLVGALSVGFCLWLRHKTVIARALFARMGTVSVALLLVIASVILINSVVFSVWQDALDKEDVTVDTTMPYSAMVQISELPATVSNPDAYHRHAYINPVDGVRIDGKRSFPLIYSTDLKLYAPRSTPQDGIGNSSVIIGTALARTLDVGAGSTLTINGRQLRVTSVADSYQYAGQIIYLSDDTFRDVFGETGNVYYGTDLSEEAVRADLGSGANVLTKQAYRSYYNGSVSGIMAIVAAVSVIILTVSAFVSYRLFSIFINTVTWKINMLRGFGISFREYAGSLLVTYLSITAGAFFLFSVVFPGTGDYLSEVLLNVTGSLIVIDYNLLFLGATAAQFLLFIGVITVLSFRSANRGSIYQQWLQTAART